MVEVKKNYEYKLYHPVNGKYLSIVLYDEDTYRDWKPYLDAVEKWFLDKALDANYDRILLGKNQ